MQIANSAAIFVPMLVVVALTFVAFLRMGVARGAAVKGGQDPNYYRAHLGPPEPEATTAAVRHYGNLFEMPTLLYAGCLTAYGTLLRLLDDLPLSGARQRYGDDEDVSDNVSFVLALEHRTSRACVVFAGPEQLRLTPPSGRWLVLDGDFGMSFRALSALLDGYCPM